MALLANPGLTRWLVDDDHPAGMVYALPHPGWVVCGGTDVGGDWSTEPDPRVHDEIVARVRSVVPELADAEVLGSRVGLRPVAPSVRLARHPASGRDVVTSYGHGGAGVTLSWGCADEVVRLVGERSDRDRARRPVGLRRALPYGAAGAKGRTRPRAPCTVTDDDSGTSRHAPFRSPSGSDTTTRVSSDTRWRSGLSGYWCRRVEMSVLWKSERERPSLE